MHSINQNVDEFNNSRLVYCDFILYSLDLSLKKIASKSILEVLK